MMIDSNEDWWVAGKLDERGLRKDKFILERL